jgi:uncharacterized protein
VPEVVSLEGDSTLAGAADSDSSIHIGTEILELTRSECLRLLAATRVGRIVVSVTEWDRPLIRPVNYVFDESSQSVLIRSAPGSKLHALLRSAKAVFEIDGIDTARRLGWSVIIGGVSEEITNAAELQRIEGLGLEPWPAGDKAHWIRVRPNTVSGRRIAPSAGKASDDVARPRLQPDPAPPASPHVKALSPLAAELHLRNRLTVSVRAVTRGDEPAIFEFLVGLSIGSRRLRFFSAAADLRAEAHRGAAGDDADHHGVLAIERGRGVVGHAVYVRVPRSERAEVAVAVADDLHHLGLATLLIIRLAQFAEERQITRFFAKVLPENLDMLAVFRDGFAATTITGQDEVDVEFLTSSWGAAHARFEP